MKLFILLTLFSFPLFSQSNIPRLGMATDSPKYIAVRDKSLTIKCRRVKTDPIFANARPSTLVFLEVLCEGAIPGKDE